VVCIKLFVSSLKKTGFCSVIMERKICVIISARGYPSTLAECLNSILNLNYASLEVIFVDDGLGKSSLEVLGRFEDKIRVLESDSRGPSYARNLAAKNTDAEFIAFTDSDCVVDKGWLGHLMKGFEQHPQAVACGGTQQLPVNASAFEKKVFLFMRKAGFITDYMRKTKSQDIAEVEHNASCCVMYKKDVFLKEGGFLEGLWPGEDVELDYRLKRKGYEIVFNPKAVVYHYRPKKIKTFLSMMYRYGWAQGSLVRKYGIFRKIQTLPFFEAALFFLFILSIILGFLKMLSVIILVALLFVLLYFNLNITVFSLGILGFIWWNIGFFRNILKSQENSRNFTNRDKVIKV